MVNMDNRTTVKQLQHFVGKPSSLFTSVHQRNMQEDKQLIYFVGFPTEINEDGIFYKSYQGEKMNFINISHLVAICEEEVVVPKKQKPPENINDLEKLMAK